MLHTVRRVEGGILWANLHLLFWLSLVPFVTGWMGENQFAGMTTSLYGFVLLMAAIAYWILQQTIIMTHGGGESILGKAVKKDYKGKVSILLNAIAIPSSFWSEWVAGTIYVLVAIIWLLPDPRIERVLED
jgi:uncharacterized membrane protein